VVAAVLLAHAGASAQLPTFEYTVREGDTCSGLARRFYGHRLRYDLIHQYNPELGPPPHRLVAGSTLVLPEPDAARAEASLTRVLGRVETRAPGGGRWSRGSRGDPLERGHQVATRVAAHAEVTWRDGSVVQLREQTLVIVYGSGRSAVVRERAHATLERGTLRTHLGALAGVVRTPSAEAALRDGRHVVQVDEEVTRVSNFDGEARVRGGDAEVEVPPETGTLVRRGARPTRPRPLPVAPRWTNDEPGRFVGMAPIGGTIRGSWAAAENALRYRVTVAREADGRDVVAAVEVPAETNAFEVHHLPRGAYYVTVATIDREHFEGRPSPPRAMVVREARVLPPGGGEPPPDVFDPGDPSEPFRPPSLLVGTIVVAPLGLRCGVERRATLSTLRTLGRKRVTCEDGAGRPIAGFDVNVVRASVRHDAPALIRDGRRVPIALALGSPLQLPDRLVARAPPGVAVGPIERREDGLFHGEIAATSDAAASVELEVQVASGAERIGIASLTLETVPPPPPPLPGVREVPPPPVPTAQEVLDALPLPAVFGLRDDATGGVRAHLSYGVMDESMRLTAGGDAQLGDEPLALGVRASFDARRGVGEAEPRRGHADLQGSVRALPFDSRTLTVAAGAELWIPSGSEGLGRWRLRPDAQLTWRPTSRLTLRTRQGAALDVDGEDGARLWLSAYGAGASFRRGRVRLGFGLEVDASVGRGLMGATRAVAAGVATQLEVGVVRLALGGRLAANDDGAVVFGRWSAVARVGVQL